MPYHAWGRGFVRRLNRSLPRGQGKGSGGLSASKGHFAQPFSCPWAKQIPSWNLTVRGVLQPEKGGEGAEIGAALPPGENQQSPAQWLLNKAGMCLSLPQLSTPVLLSLETQLAPARSGRLAPGGQESRSSHHPEPVVILRTTRLAEAHSVCFAES